MWEEAEEVLSRKFIALNPTFKKKKDLKEKTQLPSYKTGSGGGREGPIKHKGNRRK